MPWAGLSARTPGSLPRIGHGWAPVVYYDTGHGQLGWTLSAATARIVAETAAAEHAPRQARADPPVACAD
jgi:D-amino-acid dehydrogenase